MMPDFQSLLQMRLRLLLLEFLYSSPHVSITASYVPGIGENVAVLVENQLDKST